MNQDQFTSLLRILFATGGPVAGLLVNAGLNDGTVTNVLTIALIVLPPLASLVWGYIANSHQSVIASAAKIPGVSQITIAPNASDGAAAAAADPTLLNVKKGPTT